MKILVICQYYKPEPFRITDICESLVKEGHSVTVVTGTPNYPEGEIYPEYRHNAHKDDVINGVKVHRCWLIPRRQGALFLALNYYSFAFSSWWYLRDLHEDYDVVFVYQLSPVMMAKGGLMWAKRSNKKCVLYCLDLWPESLTVRGIKSGSFIYRIHYHISRRIYKKADQILVTTHNFIEYFDKVLRLGDKEISYLPQYAEALFENIPPVERHDGPYNFVYAGNIGDGQAIETVIEAARLLQKDKRIQIHMVGGGSALERCRRQAEGLTNVTFYGRREVEEMPAFYTMADAMLVTLPANRVLDTLPGRVQSYLAAGRAIVAAVGGETAEVIRDADCGMCAKAEDAEDLALKMREMVSKPEQFSIYGKNAKEYYNTNFRKEVVISELIQILEDNC